MLFCLNLKRRLGHWKREQSRKLSKGRSREGGPRGPAPNLFLDQTEARRDEKNVFEDRPPPHPPPYLSVWMTAPSPAYLTSLDPALLSPYKRNTFTLQWTPGLLSF